MINLNKEIKILYVHGFNGHPNGNSAKLLRKALKENNIKAIVDAPAIPFMEPEKAVKFINEQEGYDLIVASSLGAFFALSNGEACKILVNVAMPKDILKVDPNISKSYIDSLYKIKENFLVHQEKTAFIFGYRDTIAQNEKYIKEHMFYRLLKEIDMDHHLDEVGVNEVCKTIIKLSLCGKDKTRIKEEWLYED